MMKLFEKFRRGKKIQLGRFLFLYTVVILFFLLLAFTAFENLDSIGALFRTEETPDELLQKEEIRAIREALDGTKGTDLPVKASDVRIWGAHEDALLLLENQLKGMKIPFSKEAELDKCAGAEVLFICENEFTGEQINWLLRSRQDGMTLIFTDLPAKAYLQDKDMQELLGIEAYTGNEEKTGIRLTGRILFGTMKESEIDYTLESVVLGQRTEVYASALQEDSGGAVPEPEELAPVFWRYHAGKDAGNVYVADQILMENRTGQAVVSFLFQEIYHTYMYPVVNAYCFLIAGMPYVENHSSDYLQSVYGRDALGTENDIFFPELRRCEDRYGLTATWYSQENEAVQQSDNPLIKYYLKNIKEKGDLIGEWDVHSGAMWLDGIFPNCLKAWDGAFQWMNGRTVQIPYNTSSDEDYRSILLQDLSGARGTGFNSVLVDMTQFLDENSNADWISFAKDLETVLGVEQEEIFWLDRVTVEEAIYRILSFEVMEPEIVYGGDAVDIRIGNFTGAAYFYLCTSEEIIQTENAHAACIADGIYLVEVTAETAKIYLED